MFVILLSLTYNNIKDYVAKIEKNGMESLYTVA